MWEKWPAEEIQRDLDLVRGLGLNCVRFFLRWEDFEPERTVYNEVMFDRLASILSWHRERELLAHPSLFVGWMSGGIFWPKWRLGRNVFSDAEMRTRGVAFARKVAAVCAEFTDTILAVDLGNELCCLPDSRAAAPSEVVGWCQEISGVVREEIPGALIVSGCDQNQVRDDTGWKFGEQPGCDFYSVHAYPVSAWHSLAFDGMTDPLAQSLLPFYVKCARAWGPVIVQEFGTLLTNGVAECDKYLRAVLPASFAAGANGFLWWCLRDIDATGHPYNKNPFEMKLGLVDRQGDVKAGLRYFLEFARGLTGAAAAVKTTNPIYIYWPQEYYLRENPLNPGNDPSVLSRQLGLAHFAVQSLGYSAEVTRHDILPDPAAGNIIVVAGAKMTRSETANLLPWVERGGKLVIHGPDIFGWGAELSQLLGAMVVDYCAPRADNIEVFGRQWSFHCFPRSVFPKTRSTGAEIIVSDAEAKPFLLRNHLGSGVVATCLAECDATFAERSDERGGRKSWLDWYAGMIGLLRT